MKKAEIIKSKHVDHIENEKNILEKIQHPFIVCKIHIHSSSFRNSYHRKMLKYNELFL
jgi:hypothetical protein